VKNEFGRNTWGRNLNFPVDNDRIFFIQGSHFFFDRGAFPVGELSRCLEHLEYGVGNKYWLNKRIDTVLKRGDQGFLCYVVNTFLAVNSGFKHCPITLSATPEAWAEKPITFNDVVAGKARTGFVH